MAIYRLQKLRVIITGGTGLFAVNAAVVLRKQHDVTLLFHTGSVCLSGVQGRYLDLTSTFEIERSFQEMMPDLVIHTAALTSIEACESDRDLALEVNRDISANVARACFKYGVKLVHLSTDQLFDGSYSFLSETTPVSPLNVYGATKAAAENEVQAMCPTALIVRTNFFWWGTKYRASFSDWVLDGLANGQQLSMFHDVLFTPISIPQCLDVINGLVAADCYGIYNVTSSERLSKLDFGLKLAEVFSLDAKLIESVSIDDMPELVKRPLDMSLSNEKVSEVSGVSIKPLFQQIVQLKDSQRDSDTLELRSLNRTHSDVGFSQ